MWNFGLIIFSPSCGEKRLSHNSHAYLHLDKDRASQCQNLFSRLCIKKTFLFKTGSLLCLGAIFLSVLINCAFSLWNALPHFCSASNQNNFKVLFPLCFSQDLQYQNKLQSSLQNFFSLQILLLEKLENKYTIWLLTLRLLPWNVFSLNTHQIDT